MIDYPKLKPLPQSRQTLRTFRGLHYGSRIGEGEFADMENMTADHYPLLSVRSKRSRVCALPEGGCTGMYYVPGKGLFYCAVEVFETGTQPGLWLLTEDGKQEYVTALTHKGTCRFALLGSVLVVLPDMRCVDLPSLNSWPMGETWRVTSGLIEVDPCDITGQVYNIAVSAQVCPAEPEHGQIWMNTGSEPSLNRYDANSGQWVTISSPYMLVKGLGDHNFYPGDGIFIQGLEALKVSARLSGTFIVEHAGHGFIVIAGLCPGFKQDAAAHPVTMERRIPKMDFLVEAGNRLWGCAADGHEIYGSKLGDYKNWNCFQGLSTDSWTGSVGTPGRFTAAAVLGGYPVFYKQACKHKLWPAANGAHQITTAACSGVAEGSAASVAVLEGTVFYLSPEGICADDGGAAPVGQALAPRRYHDAVGCVHGHKYYVSMADTQGKSHLLVYDLRRKLWHREDDAKITCFASDGVHLYAAIGDTLWDLTGKRGTPEEAVTWMVQTADLGLELPDQKYISRLTLRLSLEPGATVEVFVLYDGQKPLKVGRLYGRDLRSFSLPIRPRRCDRLRLRLQGKGMCRLWSVTKTVEKGSELP